MGDLFATPLHPQELPTFSTLLSSPQPLTPSNADGHDFDSGADILTVNGFLSHSDDSDAGEGGEEVNPSILRSKRRKLEEIPSRERWRCPHDGCGREYKRTSTTSIGQHKEQCTKRPVLQARPIFQLQPTVHRLGYPSGTAIAPAIASAQVLGYGGMGGGLDVHQQTLMQAQQQLQQQTQQQIQAQLLQQQQALLQQQQLQALSQGGLGLGHSLSSPGFLNSGFQPASLPYNPLVTMTLSALNDQLMGLSSRSQSSPLREPVLGSGLGQVGALLPSSPMRPIPTQPLYAPQQAAGVSQSSPSSSYEISVGFGLPNLGFTPSLPSELPSTMSSAGPPALPLAASTSPQSLMKPVARRMEDGTAAAMMGHLSSMSLQQLRQFGWA